MSVGSQFLLHGEKRGEKGKKAANLHQDVLVWKKREDKEKRGKGNRGGKKKRGSGDRRP